MVSKKIAEQLHERWEDPRGMENGANCPKMDAKGRYA